MSENLNPIQSLYNEFAKILHSLVIKYNVRAENYETMDTKAKADQYLDAYFGRDRFESYINYTKLELSKLKNDVGLALFGSPIYEEKDIRGNGTGIWHFTNDRDEETANDYLSNNYAKMPTDIKDKLTLIRREKTLKDYTEQNDYYRVLNGKPPINTDKKDFHYPPQRYQLKYNLYYDDIDVENVYLNTVSRIPIPIHEIEDVKGIDYIELLRGLDVISTLQNSYPNDAYLHYLGKDRISIAEARNAKNFEILCMEEIGIRTPVITEFKRIYEQARSYFTSVIYVTNYRNVISYYDEFIALCIMVMTMQQLIMHQLPRSIDREFFDVNGVKMLYEAYNVPHNLGIDDYTQKGILQYLNLLIQNKSTNKVIFDICGLLGFKNIELYKYYLGKVRKFDNAGVPIIEKKNEFNNITGMEEEVYDYEKMYDFYFHKVMLDDDDYTKSLKDLSKKVPYESVTSSDPYWYDDTLLKDQLWKTEYNFVESKYLGMGLSYSMSEIMFENVILFKLLMSTKEQLSTIRFTVPKITSGIEITLFEAIILLCCLTCKNHKIGGEIITVPTQVVSVLDYMHNQDVATNDTVDTLQFNFEYFADYMADKEYLTKKRMIEILEKVKDQLFDKYTNSNVDSSGVKITPEYVTNITYLYIDKYGYEYPDLESMLRVNVFDNYSVPSEQQNMIIRLFGEDALNKYGDRERITLMKIDMENILNKKFPNDTSVINDIIDSVLFSSVMAYIGSSKHGGSEQMKYTEMVTNVEKTLSSYKLDNDTINDILEMISPDFMKTYDLIDRLMGVLDKDDADRLKTYVSALSIPDASNKVKIDALNGMYQNIKNLYKFISVKLSETTDRKTYEMLKQLHRTAFYSKEMKELFTINKGKEMSERTANNFFEYLYNTSPTLYSAMFTTNITKQYREYLDKIRDQYNTLADEISSIRKMYGIVLKPYQWMDLYINESYSVYMNNLDESEEAGIKVRHPNISVISGENTEYSISLYIDDILKGKIEFPDTNLTAVLDGQDITLTNPRNYSDWLITYKRWSEYKYYKEVFNTDTWLNPPSPDFNPIQNVNDYIIDCFECDVERGFIKIKYDTMIDEDADDSSNMKTKIYYYTNHLISRLENYIDGLKFVYLTNDTSTPLSDLLIKLIRFFKSFTVDILNMDIVFVFDLKEENMLKFFDEISKIVKDIEVNDHMHVTYSDVIHRIIVSQFATDENGDFDKMTLKDKVIMRAIYSSKSHLLMSDTMFYKKTIGINKDQSSLRLHDEIASMNYSMTVKDKDKRFHDKIYMKYSEPT